SFLMGAVRVGTGRGQDESRFGTLLPTTGGGAGGAADCPGPMAPSPFGRYQVIQPHARGGIGEVLLARDQELGREIALKRIQDAHADDPESRARFVREAELTGNLEHPGIVPVYGCGRAPNGRPYYAMRFIRGESLEAAITRFHDGVGRRDRDPGGRSPGLLRLLERFNAVCDAVEYAHSRGVLHCDLKPGNVMLGAHGETLVVDWGLAKPLGRLGGPCLTAPA